MLISLDHLQNPEIEIGELLTVVVVKAANVIKDTWSNFENLKGGHMTHYERLIEDAVETALTRLKEKAESLGYDGVIGVKIANPSVVTGGAEVIVYGNGFKSLKKDSEIIPPKAA